MEDGDEETCIGKRKGRGNKKSRRQGGKGV
jgi:hypothetical protein